MKKLFLFIAALALGGCSTYMPQRYSISADNNVALKASGAKSVGVGDFSSTLKFDNFCRGVGPIAPPDGMSPFAYIKKALVDELKVAGIFAERDPQVILTGRVQQISFSSSRRLTGGSWDIELNLASSNGKSVLVSEHYEFESGFNGETACKQTAEAFMPAVQDLIGKVVRSPDFPALVAAAAPPAAASVAAPPPPVVAPVASPPPAPVPPQPPAVAVFSPPPPPALPKDYAPKFSYQALAVPDVRACNPEPEVTLAAVSPGVEVYSARCTRGEPLMLRCEWGACRVLR